MVDVKLVGKTQGGNYNKYEDRFGQCYQLHYPCEEEGIMARLLSSRLKDVACSRIHVCLWRCWRRVSLTVESVSLYVMIKVERKSYHMIVSFLTKRELTRCLVKRVHQTSNALALIETFNRGQFWARSFHFYVQPGTESTSARFFIGMVLTAVLSALFW